MINPLHLTSARREQIDKSSSSSSSSSQVEEDVLQLGELVYSQREQETRLQGAFSGNGVARYRLLGVDVEPLTLLDE